MRDESHLDDMRSAIRGDFERLAERRGGQELMRSAEEPQVLDSSKARPEAGAGDEPVSDSGHVPPEASTGEERASDVPRESPDEPAEPDEPDEPDELGALEEMDEPNALEETDEPRRSFLDRLLGR